MTFKVSVIIPNYNNEKYLSQCLNSVINQTYSSIEIVVVDDVSTDLSRDIIDEFASKYSHIEKVYLEKNGGVSNARNIGAKNATGDYLVFLDADDFFWSNKKIENEINLIQKYLQKGEKIIAYSGVVCVNEAGEYTENRGVYDQLEGDILVPYIARYKEEKHARNVMIDKDIFEQTGGFDTNMSFWEDSDWFIKILFYRKIYCTNELGVAYRWKSFGLSHTNLDGEKVLKSIEKKYFLKLSLYEKLKFFYYKIARCIYRFKIYKIPKIKHYGSKIKRTFVKRGNNETVN